MGGGALFLGGGGGVLFFLEDEDDDLSLEPCVAEGGSPLLPPDERALLAERRGGGAARTEVQGSAVAKAMATAQIFQKPAFRACVISILRFLSSCIRGFPSQTCPRCPEVPRPRYLIGAGVPGPNLKPGEAFLVPSNPSTRRRLLSMLCTKGARFLESSGPNPNGTVFFTEEEQRRLFPKKNGLRR